jgi:hypothetical protein
MTITNINLTNDYYKLRHVYTFFNLKHLIFFIAYYTMKVIKNLSCKMKKNKNYIIEFLYKISDVYIEKLLLY